MRRSIWNINIPPGQTPGHLTFLIFSVQIPLPRALKHVQMPLPRGHFLSNEVKVIVAKLKEITRSKRFEQCASTILVKSIWYTLKICYVFIIAPCSMTKVALFPKLGPPPPPSPSYNVASRGALWAHWFNIVWGGGGGGRNGEIEIVKKGQVYHDFWPGL